MFFFLQKDLGPALLLCCVFLAVYAVARGRVGLALAGFALLAAGFYVGYRLQHLADAGRARPHVAVAVGQRACAAAIRSRTRCGRWRPAGASAPALGLGDTRYLPAGHTDLVLAAIGEELGVVGLVAVAALYARSSLARLPHRRRAATDYGFFLAIALTLFLVVPVLVMAAGMLG